MVRVACGSAPGYLAVTEQLPFQERSGMVSDPVFVRTPSHFPKPTTPGFCLAFCMKQTTWHASGATDAPPQVFDGNTEASANRERHEVQILAPAETPTHPFHPPLLDPDPDPWYDVQDVQTDRDRVIPTSGAGRHRYLNHSSLDWVDTGRDALMEKIEGALSSVQGSPYEEIVYQELAERLRKRLRMPLSMPDYGATQLQEKGISPGAPGPIADFELRELQTAVDAGPKRVELRASQEFVDTLDSLAQETKLSRAHVIRRAIALYERALLEKSQGNVIGIAALENNQIKLKEILQV